MSFHDHRKSVCVLGLGYIGLPTAAAFASRRVRVLGVDVSAKVVDTVNQGRIHIVEPELDMLVQSAVASGYLRAAMQPEVSDVFLIAVPTPFVEGHCADIRYIESATRAITPFLKKGDLVVLESTSPVGTTERMAGWLAEGRPDLSFPQEAGEASDIRVAHCPERVLPGKVVRELVENHRVIGGMTPRCAEEARGMYEVFVEGECSLTDARTAEMCKLAENAFRDVNIAYANEMSVVCDRLGIEVRELIRLANLHPRVEILQPGPGVGGHCIAVDPWFIVESAPDLARLVRTAREVNDGKPSWVVGKVAESIARFLEAHPDRTPDSVRIACLGLTFKADIDDIRESPALEIVGKLAATHPGPIMVIEPHLESLPQSLAEVPLSAMEGGLVAADIAVVLVKHRIFDQALELLREVPVVVDVVGLLEPGARRRGPESCR